jgi:hypothetical protein
MNTIETEKNASRRVLPSSTPRSTARKRNAQPSIQSARARAMALKAKIRRTGSIEAGYPFPFTSRKCPSPCSSPCLDFSISPPTPFAPLTGTYKLPNDGELFTPLLNGDVEPEGPACCPFCSCICCCCCSTTFQPESGAICTSLAFGSVDPGIAQQEVKGYPSSHARALSSFFRMERGNGEGQCSE